MKKITKYPELIHSSWYDFISLKTLNEVQDVLVKYYKNKDLIPYPNRIFRSFSIDVNKINAIFIGQSPYKNLKNASGLSFGTPELRNYNDYPYSLKLIADAINIDMGYNHENLNLIFDNTLIDFEDEGIMLTNAALTCNFNNSKEHIILWEKFWSKILPDLTLINGNICIYTFGTDARNLLKYVNLDKQNLFHSHHPASTAYNKNIKFIPQFKALSERVYYLTGKHLHYMLPF